ncbi:MAG TPA: lysylphosphatidylglycerol synthase domain-containing protein [Kofleriaceae bacterium]|jgi:uncharacterized membrane protein YbhN (UPF0104 family)
MRWLLRVAGAVAFAEVLRHADLRGAWTLAAAAGPVLALGLAPYLVQIALDALAWRTLLAALGHRLAWARLVRVRLGTEAVLLTLPGGSLVGESLKPVLLAKHAPVSDVVASVAVKRALLAAAESVYLWIALAAAHDYLAAAAPHVVAHLPLLVGIAAAILLAAAIGLGLAFASAGLAARAHALLTRLPIRRLRDALATRRDGFAATDEALVAIGRHRARLAAAWLLLLAAWLVEFGETYLLLRLVGVSLPPAAVLGMEAAVVFARNAAVFVPAGLGVQDAGYLAFLGAYGIVAAPAAAFVLVKRVKELVWIAVGYASLAGGAA